MDQGYQCLCRILVQHVSFTEFCYFKIQLRMERAPRLAICRFCSLEPAHEVLKELELRRAFTVWMEYAFYFGLSRLHRTLRALVWVAVGIVIVQKFILRCGTEG
jgi:hypothetical protein